MASVQEEMLASVNHSNTKYVRHCAQSDLLHFELQGVEPPQQLSVDVIKLGTLELLRTVVSETEKIRAGDFGGVQRQESTTEERTELTPADLDGSQEQQPVDEEAKQ